MSAMTSIKQQEKAHRERDRKRKINRSRKFKNLCKVLYERERMKKEKATLA